MQEGTPPPGCSRHTKLSLSTGAAYLARRTLLLTEAKFRVRFNTALLLAQGKLDIRSYAMREFFKEEQHAECMNLMELREVARDILLCRSTTERRACPEWLNCWVHGSEMLTRHHPGKPACPNTKTSVQVFNAWLATLPPQDLLPVYMVQIATWFADATGWQMESRQRHGTCIIPSADLIEAFPSILTAPTSIGNAANVWCLPAASLPWSNAMVQLQDQLCQAAAQMAARGLSFRLKPPKFVPLQGERPQRPREYWPERNFKWTNADKEDPRPAWRPFPRPDHHLKDDLHFPPYTAQTIASIAHCPTFMALLRTVWTKDGWMDPDNQEDLWDEDTFYAHFDAFDAV